MADTLPTVWDADPHTLAKHAILERYLQAWFPILTQQAAKLGNALRKREILYIDGFAGPGRYSQCEPGSPVIALNAVLQHPIQFPVPVRMFFVEQREDRFEHLKSVLAPFVEQAKKSRKVKAVEILPGECGLVLNNLLANCEQKGLHFGPALAFFDQFGYSAVTMDLIARVLSYGQCEVFTYLGYKDMNRWITDPDKAQAFTGAYGGEEWRECVNLPEKKQRAGLLERYTAALKSRAKAKYVTFFLMFDNHGQPLYWLLFCTNNLRGLEEMKAAMWRVDKTGGFRFSDRDNPAQLRLLDDSFSQAWLAEELQSRLAGREMKVAAIKEFVLTDTPCYLFKRALKSLEKNKRAFAVQAPAGRKPGTFNNLDKIILRFPE
jgi:three-Cys-motif partner protein